MKTIKTNNFWCRLFGHNWRTELNYNSVRSSWDIPYQWTSPWRKRKHYQCERCGYEEFGESKFVRE